MDSKRPERRTALIGCELERYKIDIAALSETRLADESQLEEVGILSTGLDDQLLSTVRLVRALLFVLYWYTSTPCCQKASMIV